MTRKKKKEQEQKPACWYCDRKFDDEKTLIVHQRARHFKCEVCHRRLNSVGGLKIHFFQVHNRKLETVPHAMAGRQSTEHDGIYGVDGVPPPESAEGDYGGEGDDDDPADADGAPKRPRLGEGGAVSASFGTGAYGGTPLGAGMTASTSLAPPTLGLPPGFVPRPPAGGMGLPPGFAPVALGLPPGFGGVGVTASAPPIASAAAVGQAFAAGVVPGMPVGEVLVYDNADYQMEEIRASLKKYAFVDT